MRFFHENQRAERARLYVAEQQDDLNRRVYAFLSQDNEGIRDARRQNETLATETRCAREELVVSRNTVSWLQSRINQLELDKAQLLHRILNPSIPVPIAVPELVQERGGDPRLRPDIDRTGTEVADLPDAPFAGAINWDDDPKFADPEPSTQTVGDGAPRS